MQCCLMSNKWGCVYISRAGISLYFLSLDGRFWLKSVVRDGSYLQIACIRG